MADCFEYIPDMEHVRVGVVRESMLQDPLLIKSTLGKTKSTGIIYPGPDFVYGKATTSQDGGVAEAISDWYTPPQPPPGSLHFYSHTKPERDFVALNREAVKSGVVTAKDIHHFCKTHNIRSLTASEEGCRPTLTQMPQDAVYGVSTRSSTPMSDLLQYKFAREWIKEQQARDIVLLSQQPKKMKGVQDTRTTLLRKSRPLEEETSLWKIPRYEKVGAALDTFRCPEERKRAMAIHYSESVARRGQLGQGTYTVD